jgi:valyl-tRNA synthetase
VAVEAEVGALVELVRSIRNARAEARVEPAAWLPVRLAVPPSHFSSFAGLRSAVERLGRARPLEVVGDRAELGGAAGVGASLAVVAGDLEALVLLDGGASATPDADRARLEKELAEAEGYLAAARARLANEAFTSKAPAAVVEGARAREAELADQVERLRARLG